MRPVRPVNQEAQKARRAFRKRFDVGDNDIIVLFAGRLAFHAKANPMLMYAGLEEAAKRTGKKTVLDMSGWFGSDTARDQFASAAKILSPTLKVVSVDSISRMPDVRFQVWQATDIFASMSNKIQETFGTTLIEAMAAVLPIVSSEWDGYRDTVINDETEIMVPTLMAPPRDGDDLAYPNDSGADDYDHYVGTAAQFTAVDPFKVEDAFEVLMVNADKPVVDVQRLPMTGRSSSASTSSFGRSWKEAEEIAGGCVQKDQLASLPCPRRPL